MTAIWTKRFVNTLLVLVAIAALAAVIQAAGSIADGKFHMVSYPASSENIRMEPLGGESAWWQMQAGTVRVDDHSWLRAARLVGRLAGLALLAGMFWQLRGLLVRIAEGDVFSDANVAALKRVGKLLIATSVLSISITFMTQYAILEAIPDMAERAIHPSISWNVKGVENIWMEYTPPIIPVLLAMISFITAGAFQSGKNYREDSESVV
ncbi:DUF2975 domain-containing protein [Pontixanthobacter aquaemixtae]|uniref:DUF2975 domain-containing protein n=1 Tax=Pontixanthobacter aquaemixtae TaxID=1958940 RepID=A0A844ZX10_9SPHN|nr:DUF2975 domain-containing protein [Pontixanthobacter aquaemixtae]MXO90039.1 DUF2975 domain-containing protein [Pontixanthobacter aquaemixtae]